MSHVIEFLERLGQDARLRHATNDEVAQELALAGIEDPARATILWGDRQELERLLGAKANVFCGVLAPEEEEEEEKDDEKKDDEKEDDEKEDDGEEDDETE